MNQSDPLRLLVVHASIQKLKHKNHAVVRPVTGTRMHQIVARTWAEIAEPSKLQMLNDLVDWSGITNRDQAHILLAELDVGKLPRKDRDALIRDALSDRDLVPEQFAEAERRAALGKGIGMER